MWMAEAVPDSVTALQANLRSLTHAKSFRMRPIAPPSNSSDSGDVGDPSRLGKLDSDLPSVEGELHGHSSVQERGGLLRPILEARSRKRRFDSSDDRRMVSFAGSSSARTRDSQLAGSERAFPDIPWKRPRNPFVSRPKESSLLSENEADPEIQEEQVMEDEDKHGALTLRWRKQQ